MHLYSPSPFRIRGANTECGCITSVWFLQTRMLSKMSVCLVQCEEAKAASFGVFLMAIAGSITEAALEAWGWKEPYWRIMTAYRNGPPVSCSSQLPAKVYRCCHLAVVTPSGARVWGVGFMTYTEGSNQGAIQTRWLPCWRPVMLSMSVMQKARTHITITNDGYTWVHSTLDQLTVTGKRNNQLIILVISLQTKSFAHLSP